MARRTRVKALTNAKHGRQYFCWFWFSGCLESPGSSAGRPFSFSAAEYESRLPDCESAAGRADADDFHRCQRRGVAHLELYFPVSASESDSSALCFPRGAPVVSLHQNADLAG